MKTIVELNNFPVSKVLRDAGQIVCTNLVANTCCHRTTTLCVVAIHDVEPAPEVPEHFLCSKKGINIPDGDLHLSRDCGCGMYYHDKPQCFFCSHRHRIAGKPALITGIFSVSLREREGKIPVIHLNPTEEEVNALFVDLEDGGLHDESSYSVISGGNGVYFCNTTSSGGGSTQNTRLYGFLPFGSVIKHYQDTYKGRRGDSVTLLDVTPEGLKEKPIVLTDGLEMQDILNPE